MWKSRFKKFGGPVIPDIIEYIKGYIEKEPGLTISIGCDSMQKRRSTTYAITLMFYNKDIRNGAHVVFFRETHPKIRDIFERLHKEAAYMHDIGMWLNDELSKFYKRSDLDEWERKKYKYHMLKSDGTYPDLQPHQEENFIKMITLSPDEKEREYLNVDVHLDYNPFDGNGKNKSNMCFRTYVPWLRSVGFRVYCKNLSYAATSAADLLLK